MHGAYVVVTIDRSIGDRGTRVAPVPGTLWGSSGDSARGSGEQLAGEVQRVIRETKSVTQPNELQRASLAKRRCISKPDRGVRLFLV